jgi:hypothetical protein
MAARSGDRDAGPRLQSLPQRHDAYTKCHRAGRMSRTIYVRARWRGNTMYEYFFRRARQEGECDLPPHPVHVIADEVVYDSLRLEPDFEEDARQKLTPVIEGRTGGPQGRPSAADQRTARDRAQGSTPHRQAGRRHAAAVDNSCQAPRAPRPASSRRGSAGQPNSTAGRGRPGARRSANPSNQSEAGLPRRHGRQNHNGGSWVRTTAHTAPDGHLDAGERPFQGNKNGADFSTPSLLFNLALLNSNHGSNRTTMVGLTGFEPATP